MSRVGSVLAGALLAWLCIPQGVQAQDDEAAARQHFRLGTAYYENGQFPEAAREFEEAYRLSHRPRLLYNAYLAYRDMQDLPSSARTLRQFLAESTDLEQTERDQLQARLTAIDAALARQQTSMPPDSTPPAETPSTQASDPPADASPASGGFHPSPVGFVIGGVGVALEVAAIITGVLSSADYATLSSQCSNGICPDRQDLRDAQSRGQMLATLTDVLWVSGVVAIGVGVALIFALQEGGEPSTTADVSCGPTGCYGVVRTRF